MAEAKDAPVAAERKKYPNIRPARIEFDLDRAQQALDHFFARRRSLKTPANGGVMQIAGQARKAEPKASAGNAKTKRSR